ncbi:hypothetical protein EYD45_01730 [Hyunsoonleella flava]|uniref:Carboxypeptidase-like regulatory domain-containing protein n=1 Tax=Hyunsoonleella flava TaxID=2527939 RepID=A0A4Q9FH55_9FLAO|nr:hypothetical protein [Hyunsoonleella flava]TBN06629.1 hypothetical protein EYD45_01730 [Hyunsoonleella flava]
MKHLLLLLFPLTLISQNIKGKVYDSESTVKGIKVYNVSQKRMTYTNNDGDFSISAVVNDTLLFESLFHHNKMIQLKQSDFDDVVVFELRKSVNALGEVLISNDDEEFNPLEYTQEAERAFERDMKNNLQLYMNESEYDKGVNFKKLFKSIRKLLKKKNKPKPIEFVTYDDLDSLLKHDNLFSLKLLNQDLNIPEEHAHLFLDYCEAQYWNKNLSSEANKVILLDSMVNLSKEFLKITEEFKASKDTLDLKN